MYYVIDKDKSRIQINLQASYRLFLCHEVLRREIYKDSFVPVLQSFVQRKVLMVFIFVKSTVFYARYFIVLHYHTVFYFFWVFLFFCTIRKQNIGGTYLLWALGGGEGGGICG
jgi:hypothetical protein